MRTFDRPLRIDELAVIYDLGIGILENIWSEDRVEFRPRFVTYEPVEGVFERAERYDRPGLGVGIRRSRFRHIADLQPVRIDIDCQLEQLLVLFVD
jgi:hypothetical protein